ncbi:MAG: hypothetical protein IJ060_08685 [Oscillospiraceae bacterium]|nr:hypothetical protein [Oscillospiraceae bacterium]
MKAYPLIYSRTLNFDFVSDFLTRPADLDYQTALKYVGDALFEPDFLEGIRYSAFAVGDYFICGGLTAISKTLFALVRASGAAYVPEDVSSEAEAYLHDCKGRKIACFIGVAIPKSEVQADCIPDVTTERYWHIYLEYLRHQWASVQETASEKLEFPPLELDEKKYNAGFVPQSVTIGTHNVIRQADFDANRQQILDDMFHRILSGADDSLMTEIEKRSFWEKTQFRTTVVSEELYESLKSAPKISIAKPAETAPRSSVLRQTDDGSVQIRRAPQQTEQPPRERFQPNDWGSYGAQKKTESSDPRSKDKSPRRGSLIPVLLAAAAALIILVILIRVIR